MDSSWKNSWDTFFFLSELSPFLELCPFEKIRLKFDACHILWTLHARVLKFHIWIPHGRIADQYFFSCPSYLPFWSYAPLKKNRMKSDACHILWILHTRVLKFHIWIPHGKIAELYFFLVRVISLSGVMPLWKKSIWHLVSKISWKVFELGAWNLVSW